MKIKLSLALVISLSLLNCTSTEKAKPGIDLGNILIQDIGDVTRAGGLNTYSADSLYNLIGGVSEKYIGYGVIRVANTDYVKDNFIYSVSLYEFEKPLGAFGIYARNRIPTDRFINLGTESLVGSGYLYYVKDRYFMTINAMGEKLPDLTGLSDFAAALDSLISGVASYPTQFDYFPSKRLIAHSQKFWPHGFDNYAVPESCFSADYKRGSATCRLFYAPNRTITEFDTFKTLIQRKGRVMTHMAGVGRNSIYAITEEDGKVLLGFADHVIFGVLDVSNDFWAKALCEALFENLGMEL